MRRGQVGGLQGWSFSGVSIGDGNELREVERGRDDTEVIRLQFIRPIDG